MKSWNEIRKAATAFSKRWKDAYDAEDQLTSVTSASLTNGVIRVLNTYDYRHRRTSKTVQRLYSTIAPPPSPPVGVEEWQTLETRTFVYDDWNLIHETIYTIDGSTTNTTEVQYFWGLDLSDSLQGAGGVGGLLAVSRNGQFYFPVYDNNGNVTKYIDESGNIVAAYEYDDFGRIISQSCPLADFFRHRFSTKYYDAETGLYYYGYRFYHPILMRWLTRDPIEEVGGDNLYGICYNNMVLYVDELGMVKVSIMSRAETSFWERLWTGDRYKYVNVQSVSDIGVFEVYMKKKNGVFSYPYARELLINDCEIQIYVEIRLSSLLSSDTKRKSTINVMLHDDNSPRGQSTGRSHGTNGSRPPRGAILAHEQGHALAYLVALSRFTKDLKQFGNKKLSDVDKNKIRKLYKKYITDFNQINMPSANETEKDWYEKNGYTIEPVPGGYNAIPK